MDGREPLLVPVEDRPVDEEQALLRAGLARRLAEVSGGAPSHRVEADALRDVGVPEQVMVDERAARAEDERDALLGNPRQLVDEIGGATGAKAGEDGVPRQLAVARASANLLPRHVVAAHVDGLGAESARQAAPRPAATRRPPARRSR